MRGRLVVAGGAAAGAAATSAAVEAASGAAAGAVSSRDPHAPHSSATAATIAHTRITSLSYVGRVLQVCSEAMLVGMHSARDLLSTRWPALDVAAKRTRLQES